MAFHCGPCNNEFEFIVHQENGSEEQDFILRALKVADKTHIPGKYTTALKNDDEIVKYFEGISSQFFLAVDFFVVSSAKYNERP